MTNERRIIINTYDQLCAVGGGVAICFHKAGGWGGAKWSVLRVVQDKIVKTDRDAAWYDCGAKTFRFSKQDGKQAGLAQAIEWVAQTYGEEGPWVRNRMQDYVPQRINKQFPLER